MLFRKKLEKDSIWEQIESKVQAGDLYENNSKFYGGALGFSAGLSAGGMVGATIGGAAGGTLGGVGAVIGTPIGYVVGAIIGTTLGIPLGKYATKKLARKEYKALHQKFSKDLFFSHVDLPDIVQEINRIQKLAEVLCEYRIIKNTKEFFFNQLEDDVFTPKQKKLYNTLADFVMTKMHYTTNREQLVKWKDRVRGSIYLEQIKKELSRLQVKLINITLNYMNEKKTMFLLTNQTPLSLQKKINSKNGKCRAINKVTFQLIWADEDKDCDAIIEEGLKEEFLLSEEMFTRMQYKALIKGE